MGWKPSNSEGFSAWFFPLKVVILAVFRIFQDDHPGRNTTPNIYENDDPQKRSHIPPKGEGNGKSSTQKCRGRGYISSLEGIVFLVPQFYNNAASHCFFFPDPTEAFSHCRHSTFALQQQDPKLVCFCEIDTKRHC